MWMWNDRLPSFEWHRSFQNLHRFCDKVSIRFSTWLATLSTFCVTIGKTGARVQRVVLMKASTNSDCVIDGVDSIWKSIEVLHRISRWIGHEQQNNGIDRFVHIVIIRSGGEYNVISMRWRIIVGIVKWSASKSDGNTNISFAWVNENATERWIYAKTIWELLLRLCNVESDGNVFESSAGCLSGCSGSYLLLAITFFFSLQIDDTDMIANKQMSNSNDYVSDSPLKWIMKAQYSRYVWRVKTHTYRLRHLK